MIRTMARKFHVEGTTTFRNWGVGLFVFGLWHARDGWFPIEKYLKKYPHFPDSPWQILFNEHSFYDYNRITAIVALTASLVCLIVHRYVK